MIRKTSLKLLSFGFFMVSLTYSTLLLTSQAHDFLTLILTGATAILIDGFKMVSFYFAANEFNSKRVATGTAFAIIFVFLFSVSIIGSLGYMYNTNLESAAIDSQGSSGYIRNEEMFKLKQEEIKSLEQQKLDTATSYDTAINSMPDDYITRKQEMTQEKNQAMNDIQARINNANSELKTINGNFDSIEVTSSASGYNAIFNQIAIMLNSTEFAIKTYTAQDISFYFFTMVSIIFEVSAVLCYLKSQTAEDGTNPDPNDGKKKKVGFSISNGIKKPSEIKAKKSDNSPTLSANNIQEMHVPKDLSKYTEEMFKTIIIDSIGYKAIGRDRIGKRAGLSTTETKEIFDFLKKSGDIEVIQSNTYLKSYKLIKQFEDNYKKLSVVNS